MMFSEISHCLSKLMLQSTISVLAFMIIWCSKMLHMVTAIQAKCCVS
jgi:hypothetical protein